MIFGGYYETCKLLNTFNSPENISGIIPRIASEKCTGRYSKKGLQRDFLISLEINQPGFLQ